MGCCKIGKYSLENCELCLADKNVLLEDNFDFPLEELELQSFEYKTKFHQVGCRQIINELLLNCSSHLISSYQLKKALDGIGIANWDPKDYQQFKEEESYSLMKLCFSGILIGEGSNEDKLYCLFSLLDSDGSQYIAKTDMINSIIALTSLSAFEDMPTNPYTMKLTDVKSTAISKLISELCGFDKISQTALRELITAKDMWFIFSSKFLRTWMFTLSPQIKNEIQRNPRNPFIQTGLTEESTGLTRMHRESQPNPTESVSSNASQASEKLPNNIHEEILSSESDSSGPIFLQVKISKNEEAAFYFYPNEDPIKKAIEFAEAHHLAGTYKEKLLVTVGKLKNQLG